MKAKPPKPGQHEDQLVVLARIEELVKKQVKIEVHCCDESGKEILAVVKEILSKINDDLANRATLEEVNSILGPVLERIKQVP